MYPCWYKLNPKVNTASYVKVFFELYLYASIVSYICTKHAGMSKSSYKKIFIPSQTGRKKKKKDSPFIQNMNNYLSLLAVQPYATVKYT